MKNKNGFISMALVSSFMVLFLFLVSNILTLYMQKNSLSDAIEEKISSDIDSAKNENSRLMNMILKSQGLAEDGNGGLYKNSINNTYYFYFKGKKVNETGANDSFVANNFILFGYNSQSMDERDNICWNIVKTNSNNTIKLLYYGELKTNGCQEVIIDNKEQFFADINYNNINSGKYISGNILTKIDNDVYQNSIINGESFITNIENPIIDIDDRVLYDSGNGTIKKPYTVTIPSSLY